MTNDKKKKLVILIIKQHGHELLQTRDFDGALNFFKNAIKKNIKSKFYWHGLALTYALREDAESFLKLIIKFEANFKPDIDFITNIYLDLVSRPTGYSCTEKLANSLPTSHPSQILALYFAGCSLLSNGNMSVAFEKFELFKNFLMANKPLFPISKNTNLNIMFRHAFLIERPEIVKQIEEQDIHSFPDYNPGINFDRPPYMPHITSHPIFLSCCNDLYFRKFGYAFLKSIIAFCPNAIAHIHLTSHDKTTKNTIDQFRKDNPDLKLNFSIENNTNFNGSVYFSCNRFLLIERLLKFYKSNITIFDIDGELIADPTFILRIANKFDFSCFSSERKEPASIYQAGVTFFSFTPQTIIFSQLLKKFILLKLKLPQGITWLLDQAALFSVIKYMEKDNNFKLNDFSKTHRFSTIKRSLADAPIKMPQIFKVYDDPKLKLDLMKKG